MFQIYDLTCNGLRKPIGIDEIPKFAWRMKSDKNATEQSTYRIVVEENGKLMWNSGSVKSSKNSEIQYEGEPLRTGRKYEWYVRCQDNYGEEAISDKQLFYTGMLETDFQDVKWIRSTESRKPLQDVTNAGAVFSGQLKSLEHPEEQLESPIYFRREFVIKKAVKNAVIFATAQGIYDLFVDGKQISPMYAPEYTSYQHYLEYQSMDITDLLKEGKHAVGIILADGWYTGKIGLMGVGNQYGDCTAVAMKMRIEYEDGTVETLVSDDTFRWNYGAYIYADLFVGEYVDIEKMNTDFARAGYVDKDWHEVDVAKFKVEVFKGRTVEPIEVLRTIKPTLIHTPSGEWVLDAGENIVGFTGVDMICPVDTELALEHSEVLDNEGNFLQNIMGQNKNQKDRLICKSGQKVTYQPHFTFHGFRYVKITGLVEVHAENFTIYVVGSNLKQLGTFTCSNEDLNQLQNNIFRSQQGNMLAIPTDCPQRERAGWTGDMQVYAPTAVFNMDVYQFLKRWLFDMRLEQLEDGQIPNVIPTIDSNKYIDGEEKKHICSAGWGDACVIVPYRLYQAYGDIKVLEENFEMMQKWMAFIETELDENGLWNQGFHFGDWLIPSIMAESHDPMQTAIRTKEEVASAMYAYTTDMMINICTILGKTEDASHYLQMNAKTRKAFSDIYISDEGVMRQQLQGLYVLAIQMNLVEKSKKDGLVRKLVELIHEADDCLDTGFLSVPFLLDALCECGENELAYKVLMQKKAPSWLYAVTKGATTIWENWMAILPDGIRTNSSYNHFAFGCVGDFMYRKIGGLQMEAAGYQKVHIEPDFTCGLTFATTTYDSQYGEIIIDWKRDGLYADVSVVLPPGTSGSILIEGKCIEIDNGRHEFKKIKVGKM